SALHASREGREMSCDAIRRVLSDGEGRTLRARPIRAHLRACPGCRDFQRQLRERPGQLAALAPPLPVAAGAALLAHLVPGAKAVAGASSAGAGVATGRGLAGGLAAKVAVVAVIGATAAGGAVPVSHHRCGSAAPPAGRAPA